MKTVLATLLLGAVFAAPAASERGSTGALVKVAYNAKLKRSILVDARGFSLYVFFFDPRDRAICVGSLPIPNCQRNWPPLLTTGKPRAGAGARAALLGTTRRSDGRLQVTYNHRALYFFHGFAPTPPDRKPGDVNGQDLGSHWWVLSPAGVPIKP